MADEVELARGLIERLASDSRFRREFRRDPVGVAREAGLDGVAAEMLETAGDPLQTLDRRESRSSLAGVVMAAAVEGIGIGELLHGLSQHSEAVASELPRTPGPPARAMPVADDGGAEVPATGARWHDQVEPVDQAGPVDRAEPVDQVDQQAGVHRVVHAHAHADAQAHAAAAAHEHAAPAGDERVDPRQYGMDGTGGPPSPETHALLHNHRVTFDADGIADLRSGRIDPRLVSLLTSLSRQHHLTISAMCRDHPKLTTNGSVSNHWYGRALDIATVDGQPVGPGNEAAKRIAIELARMDPRIRPSEIGSPWALSGAAYFSDAAHQNHLHIGFDDPISRDWRPPHALAADEQAPRSVAVAAEPTSPPAEPTSPPADDESDGQVREDGGSGDTDAEADDESDDGVGDSRSDDPSDDEPDDEDEDEDDDDSDDDDSDDDDSDDDDDDDSDDDDDDSDDDDDDDSDDD
ncbi:MAG TPA: hypothetical protein VH276_07450, partial [Solirubrobacteraceae bacterium]|nr:hypothetical protein [Solirubrobacteraceae bacterium]